MLLGGITDLWVQKWYFSEFAGKNGKITKKNETEPKLLLTRPLFVVWILMVYYAVELFTCKSSIIIIEENFSQYCLFYGLIVFILIITLIILLQLEKSLFLLCSFAGQKNEKACQRVLFCRHKKKRTPINLQITNGWNIIE